MALNPFKQLAAQRATQVDAPILKLGGVPQSAFGDTSSSGLVAQLAQMQASQPQPATPTVPQPGKGGASMPVIPHSPTPPGLNKGPAMTYVVEESPQTNVGPNGETTMGGGGTRIATGGRIPRAFAQSFPAWGNSTSDPIRGNRGYGQAALITANGRSVIAYNSDTGTGGGGAQIDLYPAVYKALKLDRAHLGNDRFGKGRLNVRLISDQEARSLLAKGVGRL